MPLPQPRSGESESDFMARCMTELQSEFPRQDQRVAVCLDQYRKGGAKESMKESMKELTHVASLREAKALEVGEKPRYHVQVLEVDKLGANRRIYPRRVMEEAYPLYEGAKVYLDHPTKTEDTQRPERSVRDLVGYLENVGPDMSADLVVVNHKEEVCPLIDEAISTGRDLVGLSHNILGLTRIERQKDGPVQVVEAVGKVRSVDIVTEQAAGGRFREMLEGKEGNIMVETLEELKEAYPELLERYKEELRENIREEVESRVYGDKEKMKEAKKRMEEKLNELKEAISARDAQIEKLAGQLARMERERVLEGKLAESNLPEVAKERLRSIVEGQYEDMEKFAEAVEAAIKSEKEYLSKVTEAGKVTGLGSPRQEDQAAGLIQEAEKLLSEWMGVAKSEKEGN